MEPIYAERMIQTRKGTAQDKENVYNIENDVEKGFVVVKYETMELEVQSILAGKATMLLPKALKPMEEELMLIKYPDPDRPGFILCDEEETVTITMHLEEGEMEEGELEQIARILETEMRRMYPASPIEDKETIGEGLNRVCWYSLDIPLVDDLCCHIMFFRELKDGLLMGTIDCSKDVKKQWKPIWRQLLATIQDTSEKDIQVDGS